MKLNTQNEIDGYLKHLPSKFLDLSEAEKKVALSVYRLLSRGTAVQVANIENETDLKISLIKSILESFSGVYYNSNQEIIGFWGLTIQPMSHKIILDDITLYGWCAWDTLFLPEILQQEAVIESDDPITKNKLRIRISASGKILEAPAGVVVSLVEPEEDKINHDVIASFCHFVFFFESEATASEWQHQNPNTFIIPLEDAVALSKSKNEIQFGKTLVSGDFFF